MNAHRGYYSLIQYCPDLSRLEAVNVGVVLFCPEPLFIEARTSAGNDKPRRLFGSESIDREHLKSAKVAIEARLRKHKDEFKDLADLEKFIQTRANDLLMTAPRPVKVFDPEDDLDKLFKELVGGRSRKDAQKEPRQPLLPELDRLFKELEKMGHARLNWDVDIPMINRTLPVPYAYRNGIWNLVKPQIFPTEVRKAYDVAMRLAVEGDLLRKHTKHRPDESRLIVVSHFESHETGKNLRSQVFDLLREYQVELIAEEEVSNFAAKVRKEAHG